MEDKVQIKFTVDRETADIIRDKSKETGVPRTEIITQLIHTLSAKKPGERIPDFNLKDMQKMADDCWNLLNTEGALFEVEGLSDRLPAYVSKMCTPPRVVVKYPTYRVEVYQMPDEDTDQKALDRIDGLLKDITDRTGSFYEMRELAIARNGNQYVFNPMIVCLSLDIEEDKKISDNIKQVLEDNGYRCSCTPYWYIERWADIELVDHDKYFRVMG